jgi:adenosylcobyric acid synthase
LRERIVIFRLPFRGPTDEFNGLRSNSRYEVSWVRPQEFDGRARVIILPGSGRTIDDLIYLRQNGGFEAIRRHLSQGGVVVGVCGGYQILGRKLLDPHHVQGDCDEVEGLGLLPIETLFGPEMASTRTTARLLVGTGYGGAVVGEERRSGCSSSTADDRRGYLRLLEVTARQFHKPCPKARQLTAAKLPWAPATEKFDGLVSTDRRVWGTYLHCIFDNDAFLRTFFRAID